MSGDRLLPLRLACVFAIFPCMGRAQTAADLATVEQRLEAGFLSSVPSSSTVASYQASLLADGSWANIDYASTSQTNWEPLAHIDRMNLMCRAWAHPSGSLYHNAGLLADILAAYDCWITKKPDSSNWWYDQIAVPQELGECMVLIKEQLSTTRLNSGLAILQRSYIARSTNSGTNTGQNRVDRAIAGIQRGIVAGSVSITQDAFLAIADTILVTSAEGIQRDGSFHQHGAQLYNQGYGSLYLSGTLKWAGMGADTGFAFSEAKRHILTDYLLDGTRWMNRGQMIDYTASGRGVSRKGQSTNGAGLASLSTSAINISPSYRTEELEALRSSSNASNSTGAANPALAFTGGKHFWRSDLTAWHRPAAYASVKISSTRTLQPECGNGEGLKNLHLGDGVNLILRTGNEYDDIMPVWNWRKLPGTTIEQGTYSLKPSADWGVAGTSTYAGGISDGTYAGTAFKYNRRNVAAKKAWFFFDDAFVALGSDIDAAAASSQVETTLNQSLLNGAVTYSTGGSPQTLGTGTTSTGGLKWVHHDSTGYFFNQVPATAAIQSAAQSGNWQTLNTGYDTTNVTKNVFALSIRHGTAFTDGSYAYSVVPGLSGAQMDGHANPIEVLRNDATAQAARHKNSGVTQAAYYAAGSVTMEAGQTLASDSPSLVLLRPGAGSLELSASSPEAKAMTVKIEATGVPLSGATPGWFDAFGAATTVAVGLPDGDLAGSTAGLRISSDGAADPVLSFEGTGGFTSLACTIDAPVNLPGTTTFLANGLTLGFPGILSGTGSLTKSGTATLNLSSNNTYPGGTLVQGGTVNVENNQSAASGGWDIGPSSASASTVNFQSGSAVAVEAGKRIRIGNNTSSGTATQTLKVAGTVSNQGSLYVGRPGVLEISSGGIWAQHGAASINGHGGYRGSLTVQTGGSFTYEGSSSFGVNPAPGSSGPALLSIAGGTFTTSRGFANDTATSSAAASLVISGGGTLKLSADIPQLLGSAGTPFLFQLGSGGGKIHTNGFAATVDRVISNVADESGSLSKTGAGTLTLTAANTHSGGTTVASGGGTLIVTRPEALGTGPISVPKGGTASGTLALAFTGSASISNPFSGFNSTTFSGEATLPTIHHLSGDTTIQSDLTVTGTGGNGLYVRSDGGLLRLAGDIRQTVGTIRLLGLGGEGQGIVSGDILSSTGGMGVTKDGTGTWTLTGANTYNSNTNINGGTLRVGDGGSTGTLGSANVNIAEAGTLEFCRTNELVVTNPISGTGKLVQSGSGRTVLSGSTLSSGEVKVMAGTLALTTPVLADASKVEIAASAILSLEHSGTDTIQSLLLDGVPQASGTWGAPGSGADHVSPRLAGSGLLLVVAGPFENWMDANPQLVDRAEDGDPDRDGWVNLIEYALGLNPLSPNPRPASRVEDGKLVMEFARAANVPGVTLIPEWSKDLIEWFQDDIEWEPGSPTSRVRIPSDPSEQRFLRLRVVKE